MSRGSRSTPEQRVASLKERLRDLPAELRATELRQSLRDGSNFVIEQVAKLSQKYAVAGIEPELVQAYQRFAVDGHECDKGCRAKLAIVETLLPLDFDDPDFWLAGVAYQQHEPVWNGSVDTAADIRGLSAFGLVRSRLMAPSDLLIVLTDLLADKEPVTRTHAAKALAAAALPGTAALLRLKASVGDDSTEVMGACFTGLLELDAGRHLEFVAAFLNSPSDTAIEAALALGSSRNREAALLLLKACENCRPDRVEPFWISVGLSRQPEAVAFLIERIERSSPNAEHALRALAPFRAYDDIADRVLTAVQASKSRELANAYRTAFTPK